MFELTQLLCEWCKFLIEHDLSQTEKEIANFMVNTLKQTCRDIECKDKVNFEIPQGGWKE